MINEKETSTPSVQISVIIPSYNSQRYIERCLSSLLRQDTSRSYEIIVVESGTDDTAKIVREKYPQVKLIQRSRQTLPGEGRNIGVEAAAGEIIAFIDSDCIAHPLWLETAVSRLNDSYPIVGGSVANANPETLISIADYILTFNEFFPSMPKKETKFMPTCNFFCRKDVFQDLGGFRTDLLAGEDTMFSYAAAQKYRLWFDPTIQIRHHNRERLKNFLRHHFNFGRYSALLRKEAKLPGHLFAKYPLLTLLVPFARTWRISLRMARWNQKMLPKYIISFPLFFLGLLAWSYGFMKASFSGKVVNHLPNS